MTAESGGTLSVISVANENLVWGVDTANNVFQITTGGRIWNATPIAAATTFQKIYVANANDIWLLDQNGNASQSTGGPANWNAIPVPGGPFSTLSAASDGTVYGITNSGPAQPVLMQYMGPGTGWVNAGCNYLLVSVEAGSSTSVWALDGAGTVYKLEGGSTWRNVDGSLSAISVSADDQVWGIDKSSSNLCFYTGEGWFPSPNSLQQISAGNAINVWGIDSGGNAIALISSAAVLGDGSIAQPGPRARASVIGFETGADPFSEEQSTHLWIVNRAADLAQYDPSGNGKAMNSLMDVGNGDPYNGKTGVPFHDGWCQGLYAPDFVSPWCGPGKGVAATYASHFYNPQTGRNWLGSKTWTAVAVGSKLFWESLQDYADGNLSEAGKKLGMSLHYLTDLTQPMHSSSFTYLSSNQPGYHTAFEKLVLETQGQYAKPDTYTASSFTDPTEFFLSAAENSNNNFFEVSLAILRSNIKKKKL